MKSIKIVIAFVLGVIVSGIGVYALSINARDTAYDNTNSGSSATNMQDAIDDLYTKADATGGYVALFSGNANLGAANSQVELPNAYFDTKYGTISGNTITISKPGDYQIIISVSQTYSSFTTYCNLYVNGAFVPSGTAALGSTATASSDIANYIIANKNITVTEPTTVRMTYWTNQGGRSKSAATAVIVKI